MTTDLSGTLPGLRSLKIPPLYSPIPPAIHPEHALINRRTGQWAEHFQIGSPPLRRRLIEHDIGTFAARILPGGDVEVAQLLGDYVIWLFGVDDGHCEEGDLGQRPRELATHLFRLLRVAQNPETPLLVSDPLAEGVRDLRRRVDAHTSPALQCRWVDALREYFFSVVWEAEHRAQATYPVFDDYVLMRMYSGATTVIPPLMEAGHGYELPACVRDSRPVRAAVELAHFLIVWDNDIFSLHKEHQTGGFCPNAVTILAQTYDLSLEQALAQVIDQRDRAMGRFLRLRAALTQQAGNELRQYLDSLGHFIRAAQDWGTTSQRYIGIDDPALLPDRFTAAPTESASAPLSIPAVAWWWDPQLAPVG